MRWQKYPNGIELDKLATVQGRAQAKHRAGMELGREMRREIASTQYQLNCMLSNVRSLASGSYVFYAGNVRIQQDLALVCPIVFPFPSIFIRFYSATSAHAIRMLAAHTHTISLVLIEF